MSRFICQKENLKNYLNFYIAQDVHDFKGRLLVKCNLKLTERIIEAIERNNIIAIFISESPIKETLTTEENKQVKNIENRKRELRNIFHEVRDEIMSNKKRIDKPSILIKQETLKKVECAVDDVIDAILSNPFVAINLMSLEQDADYLIKHSINVCYLGLCLVANYKQVLDVFRDVEKGLSRFEAKKNPYSSLDLKTFGISCFLHDIGKISMLDAVTKDVRYENEDEIWNTIKQHPVVGYDLLFGKNVNAHSLLGVKFHHENFDGSGYPLGVGGYKIHPYSRIIRIIDSFDAGISKRPGRPKKDFRAMLGEILSLSGSYYDPEFAHLFVDMMLCGKSGLVDKE